MYRFKLAAVVFLASLLGDVVLALAEALAFAVCCPLPAFVFLSFKALKSFSSIPSWPVSFSLEDIGHLCDSLHHAHEVLHPTEVEPPCLALRKARGLATAAMLAAHELVASRLLHINYLPFLALCDISVRSSHRAQLEDVRIIFWSPSHWLLVRVGRLEESPGKLGRAVGELDQIDAVISWLLFRVGECRLQLTCKAMHLVSRGNAVQKACHRSDRMFHGRFCQASEPKAPEPCNGDLLLRIPGSLQACQDIPVLLGEVVVQALQLLRLERCLCGRLMLLASLAHELVHFAAMASCMSSGKELS